MDPYDPTRRLTQAEHDARVRMHRAVAVWRRFVLRRGWIAPDPCSSVGRRETRALELAFDAAAEFQELMIRRHFPNGRAPRLTDMPLREAA